MQDTLLRVCVVVLGLLMCPRDDPGLQEEWDDIVTVDMHEQEERLLRNEEKLDQEVTLVSEKMTHTDDEGPKNVSEEQHQTDQHVTETEDKTSVLEDVTVSKQDPEEDHADPSQMQKSRSEPETTLQTSQVDHEQDTQMQQERKQEKPQEMETFNKELEVSKNKTSGKADWGQGYLWYMWNIFSVVSMIRFLWKYLKKKSQTKQDEARTIPETCVAAEMPLPNSDTLQSFHSKCIQASAMKKWREDDFLEGFASDMVEAMRAVSERNRGMVIEDFQMLDACDIIVPFTPPEPYSFQSLLWSNQASDQLPDMQVCGQIKVMENKKIKNGCPCQSTDADDDMVCLLHSDSEVKTKITDVCDGPLCLKNTPFLSKLQVSRWFQSTIKQAWALISHKYEFELSIRYIDAPGALLIRFRSGKKVSFSMNPVVKYNKGAHFYITPCSPNSLDTFWTLSLSSYEDHLLKCLSQRLPANSCHIQTLEIAHFLHKSQTALSGCSALKDFHFKTALIHLLLTKDPSQWKPIHVAGRLRDLLDFMEKSLKKKLLHHVVIGNHLTLKFIQLPAEFTQTKPVNLFHPLVVHNWIYRHTLLHFQEMLRNTHMLIHDYVNHNNHVSEENLI